MINFITWQTRKREDAIEFTCASKLSECVTFCGNSSIITVISQSSIKLAWLEIEASKKLKTSMPIIKAVCLPPSEFDVSRKRREWVSSHEQEYGLNDQEWDEKYICGGYTIGEPLKWWSGPTWLIVIRGRGKTRTYYTLKHELKHIFELLNNIPLGTLTNSREK